MTTARRFVRFNAVGGLGAAVQLGTIWALADVGGLPYLAATAFSVAAAIAHNFVWHLSWTWRDRGLSRPEAVQAFLWFATANGLVSLAGNLIVMAALVGGAGLPVVLANVIAIATCGLVNFWLGDRLVFQPGRTQAPVSSTAEP